LKKVHQADTLSVERRRGISVKATCVTLSYRDTRINLIDTPGHVDFSAEIERSLWALDAAVLVVCAVEGVQPQTEVLFRAMQEQHLPVIFFLNKTDRAGADPDRVLEEIHQLLTPSAVRPEDTDAVTELLCDLDDELMEQYLESGMVDASGLKKAINERINQLEQDILTAKNELATNTPEAVLAAQDKVTNATTEQSALQVETARLQALLDNLTRRRAGLDTRATTHSAEYDLIRNFAPVKKTFNGVEYTFDVAPELKSLDGLFKQGGSINRNKINKFLTYAKG
jgi:small GTP-binding protein